MLAGLAPDFRTALAKVSGRYGNGANAKVATPDPAGVEDVAEASAAEGASSVLRWREAWAEYSIK